jgi:hypothetical protein
MIVKFKNKPDLERFKLRIHTKNLQAFPISLD